jgi:hypothetical protein
MWLARGIGSFTTEGIGQLRHFDVDGSVELGGEGVEFGAIAADTHDVAAGVDKFADDLFAGVAGGSKDGDFVWPVGGHGCAPCGA